MATLTPFSEAGLLPLSIGSNGSGESSLEADQLAKVLDHVSVFTASVFGSPATIAPATDPEYDESYFVVRATAGGSVEEILRMNDRWNREIGTYAGDFALKFRLALSIE